VGKDDLSPFGAVPQQSHPGEPEFETSKGTDGGVTDQTQEDARERFAGGFGRHER
jgi:hypothetical protein